MLLILALLTSGCQVDAPPPGCKLAHVTDLPLTYDHGQILTPATLNGVETNMILDTGAQGTMVSKAAASRLDLTLIPTRTQVYGIGGSRSLYLFYAHSFRLGQLHGERLGLTVSAATFDGYNRPVDGLFGADLLSTYEIDLDLPEHRVRLFKAVSGCSEPDALLNQPLFEANLVQGGPVGDSRPFVRVEVGGKSLLALVDTGAAYTAIFPAAARRLGLQLDSLASDPHFSSNGIGPDPRTAVRHVLTPVTIGTITVSHLPVAIVDEQLPDNTDMVLGMDLLSRLHVWLSFTSHMLIMQYPPGPSPSLPE